MDIINWISIIDPLKENYIILRAPVVSWKSIIEAIKIKLLRELSYTNEFLVVFYLTQ